MSPAQTKKHHAALIRDNIQPRKKEKLRLGQQHVTLHIFVFRKGRREEKGEGSGRGRCGLVRPWAGVALHDVRGMLCESGWPCPAAALGEWESVSTNPMQLCQGDR